MNAWRAGENGACTQDANKLCTQAWQKSMLAKIAK
jgi:hypothetical protein